MAAAHEASEHAGRAESTNVGATTLEQLDADVTRIANDYVHVPPVPMMVEMLRVRRRVYRLLEGHQRPSDTSHLYLLAGTLSGLLANASTDLGYYDAAGEQARASWAYAELCAHNGLRSWTRGMQALIEYKSERPRRAVQLAQAGQRYADSVTSKVRLFNIEARIWSKLGSTSDTERCIHAADGARGGDSSDTLHDEVGGVFGFNEPKSQYYAGATYIHLGQAEPALEATRRAIELYASGPTEQRSYGAEALARVDSAAAHLINGSLDGAAEALQPVLQLDEDKRIAQLEDRLTGLRQRLAGPRYRDAVAARNLDERIEEFCGATAAKGIPPGNQAG
ncbi:XRE family transcriptional regulator [Nocardia sp. NPDC050406]|uniref:XRE family transcriptional regulator n=1 Tax=Nocardia sp. NPDC050406 TaxID=3364318 RepID=UPI003796ED55